MKARNLDLTSMFVSCSNGNQDGSICHFSCDSGYELVGSNKVRKEANKLILSRLRPTVIKAIGLLIFLPVDQAAHLNSTDLREK